MITGFISTPVRSCMGPDHRIPCCGGEAPGAELKDRNPLQEAVISQHACAALLSALISTLINGKSVAN